jgi:formylmethanofuran dehydrogenase subunit E
MKGRLGLVGRDQPKERKRQMNCRLDKNAIDGATAFHGHWCPGLAVGIRAAEWALAELGGRAQDEELVAGVETDMGGVDAIQYLTGCTFGKGNLIYRDYGKIAFSFYRRSAGRAARLLGRPVGSGRERKEQTDLYRKQQEGLTSLEETRLAALRDKAASWCMTSAFNTIFEIQPVDEPMPQPARIFNSLVCDACGEAVMETCTWQYQGQTVCLPCLDRLSGPGG